MARIQRAELADRALVPSGARTRRDAAARTVLEAVALGFLSAGDKHFHTVRCRDTLGRALWAFTPPVEA
ncbi:hypothetical protein [Kitasatospora sp. NPDC097643]|uniref:hypothetical protein n=1 Tax=Kitasatospora sp. NPDC097643 TaxID=3157230 RepID=UPI00332C9352